MTDVNFFHAKVSRLMFGDRSDAAGPGNFTADLESFQPVGVTFSVWSGNVCASYCVDAIGAEQAAIMAGRVIELASSAFSEEGIKAARPIRISNKHEFLLYYTHGTQSDFRPHSL